MSDQQNTVRALLDRFLLGRIHAFDPAAEVSDQARGELDFHVRAHALLRHHQPLACLEQAGQEVRTRGGLYGQGAQRAQERAAAYVAGILDALVEVRGPADGRAGGGASAAGPAGAVRTTHRADSPPPKP